MPVVKLTKRVVDAALPKPRVYELRDTVAPGFLCKIARSGRKTFMLQYRTIGGERRRPAIGQIGELTVEQARTIAQKWLAEVREGKDPSLEKQKARQNPNMRELADEFITRHSIPNNKPSTVKSNRSYIKAHIKPRLGKLKADEVTRTDIADTRSVNFAIGRSGNAARVAAAFVRHISRSKVTPDDWGEATSYAVGET